MGSFAGVWPKEDSRCEGGPVEECFPTGPLFVESPPKDLHLDPPGDLPGVLSYTSERREGVYGTFYDNRKPLALSR